MKRILPILFLTAAVLHTGCDFVGDARPSGPPTATATPSRSGTELADRYRKAGGDADVYGIHHAKNDKGVLVLSVWTHKKAGYENVDDFATELTSSLTREGVRFGQGYVLNVYGPDGVRLHNLDTTPEHNP
ncbi:MULTISPECIES: hypothetical protein [unclassified Streptomyces]|uniref:hypothetical protein n=1 Tax=unclassified Streptomyces TaxID=2593676 RepID=UPI00131A1839|nr:MULTISPECIES: hypothetical protein [unclassified Streptomyces]MYT33907.1 hypothetical protein [Streptomyces sp. SID8354]